MRKVFFGFAVVQLVAVLAQFYLATFGAFETPQPAPGDPDAAINYHVTNGSLVIPLVSLLTTTAALAARAGGKLAGLSILPLVLAGGAAVRDLPAGGARRCDGHRDDHGRPGRHGLPRPRRRGDPRRGRRRRAAGRGPGQGRAGRGVHQRAYRGLTSARLIALDPILLDPILLDPILLVLVAAAPAATAGRRPARSEAYAGAT
ncbi:DUF6220 domain-containing protein [Microbispora rosea]|uniref:DUF6220 domain-containing protein n=1 Tax=Microbispora rosea TaxID=58117 RepID=UPI0036ACCF51